jgi:hypothetical protein
LSFDLSASTLGHLVLQFPTASSLTLDLVANPLSYWTNLNHSQTAYSLVLGELRDTFFFLYPSIKKESRVVKMTLGSLEPREWTDDIPNINYCATPAQYSIVKTLGQHYTVSPVGIDSVTIQRTGYLDGSQRLDFPILAGSVQLLAVQGLPPNSAGFYLYRSESDRCWAEINGMRVDHVVGRYENLVDFDI